MFKVLIVVMFIGLVSVSIGLMAWQSDFAETEATSRLVPPTPQADHDGVPQTVTDRSPVAGRVIASVQKFLRGSEPRPEKPTVNRGGFEQRDNFDIRYTRRPGD
ncbi:MAG: hypothetical protein AAFX45_01570 [Pseudomonadota bacterium]